MKNFFRKDWVVVFVYVASLISWAILPLAFLMALVGYEYEAVIVGMLTGVIITLTFISAVLRRR